MIQSVDQTLFRLLARGLTTLGGTLAQKPTQIRFQAPDRAWRQHVSQLSGRKALSVYLVASFVALVAFRIWVMPLFE